MENKRIDYSVVIPVYNSEKTLEELYKRLTSVFKTISFNYEIIMVDDCSHDNCWQILEKFHEKDKRIKIIQLTKNVGQHKALMCGFNHVSGSHIISMDDDLQHPPEEIPKLVNAIKEHPDLDAVFGRPRKKEHNLFRIFLSEAFNIIYSYISNKSRNLRITSFAIIKREIINKIIKENRYNTTIGMLLSVTSNIKNVTVEHHKRSKGVSMYSIPKLVRISLDAILYNSILPLKLVIIFSVIIMILCMLLGILIVFGKLYYGISLPLWKSLIVVNLFFFGAVFFLIVIIGEYLIRIIQAMSNSPLNIVRRKKL